MRRMLVIGSVIGALAIGLGARAIALGVARTSQAEARRERAPADRARAERAIAAFRAELSRALLAGRLDDSFSRALASTDDTARRRRMFDCLEAIARGLALTVPDLGRPDFVAFVDAEGRVVVRDQDPNRMRGRVLAAEVPAVARAVRGQGSAFGVVARRADSTAQLVAAEPVDGRGALVVAYRLGDGFARRLADAVGEDVAVLGPSGLLGASAGVSERRAELSAAVARVGASSALSSTELDADVRVEAAPLPAVEDVGLVLAVLPRTDPASTAERLGLALGLLALLASAVAFVLAHALGRRVLAPVGRLEDALLAVMNGQPSLGIRVDEEELGGLAFRIEQVIETLREPVRGVRTANPRPSRAEGRAATRAVQTGEGGVILGSPELPAPTV